MSTSLRVTYCLVNKKPPHLCEGSSGGNGSRTHVLTASQRSSTCLGLSFLTYQKYLSFITTLNDIDSSSTWLLYHTKSVSDGLTSQTLISES